MSNIEVEFRSKITKKKYNWLKKFLKKNAKDMGQDDKETVFYILPDKLFKVVREISKNSAKIVLKNNRIGNGNNFREWEIKINPREYEKAVEMFNSLNLPGKFMKAWQERRNYLYKGIEIAVKLSDYWKYHMEMEIMINNLKQKKEAELQIRKVANELGIKLMTNKEIKAFTKSVESKI